jgi:DNA-binding protein HU-beta
MNKSQLVDALAERLGDRRTAASAVEALLGIVVDTVRSGESVSIAGFGVFESRSRAARLGRNPRTGESVAVPATTVPAFRPGTGFRNAVAVDAEGAASTDAGSAAPRRRTAAATNGSASGAASAVLDGAVDLARAPAASGEPAADGKAGKGRKKASATAKGAKDVKDSKEKGKKGKKGKK